MFKDDLVNWIPKGARYFGGSKTYHVTQPVAAPTITETPEGTKEEPPEVTEAGEKEKTLAKKKKGRRSTILTGGQGVTSEAPVYTPYLQGKTLLGQ